GDGSLVFPWKSRSPAGFLLPEGSTQRGGDRFRNGGGRRSRLGSAGEGGRGGYGRVRAARRKPPGAPVPVVRAPVGRRRGGPGRRPGRLPQGLPEGGGRPAPGAGLHLALPHRG